MSGLPFAVPVLLAASCLSVLLLAASATSSSASRPPAVYGVSDEWRAALASNDGTRQTLNKWAMMRSFYVADVLDFKHSNDSALLVRQGDYERCSAAIPARRFADGGGDTRFTLVHPGLFYFISGAPARCDAGQRMVLRVVDACSSVGDGAPTAAPAPAPGLGMMESEDVDSPSDDSLFTRRSATAFLSGYLLGRWLSRINLLRLGIIA